MIQLLKNLLICQIIIILGAQLALCQNKTDSFSIGYKSLKYIDYSRTHASLNKELGSLDSLISYRTISCSMWYPASDCAASKKNLYSDFYSTMEMDDRQINTAYNSESHQGENFAYYFGLDEAELKRISNLSMRSCAAPEIPDRKFPLVIYIPGLNGFSFENHILCESIAKQEYVVISFNSKGTEGRWMDVVNSDFENLIRDIQYIIGESSRNPTINSTNVTLIGFSVGGHINFLTKMRDHRVGGIVSLDGSIKHDLERTGDFIFNDYSKINCPVLSISDQDFENARIYLDSMYHADRYYYQASEFEHKDYKSLSYVLANDYGTEKYNKYLLINDLIISFVNLINGKDVKFAKSQFLTFSMLKSLPDIDDLKVLIGESNFTNSILVYNHILAEYPQFSIPEKELVAWANRLKYSGFTDQAIEIYKLIIEIYPNNQSIKNKLRRLGA